MAHAYVPGLRVSDFTTLRRERILPLKGEVMVEQGQQVSADTIVARTELPGPVKTLNVVNVLGIDAGQIDSFMLKKVGDRFTAGEVIAQNKPLFGLKFMQSRVVAEFDGTVDSVSPVTGQVILRYPPRPVEVSAYVDGTVVDVRPREGVTVETRGSYVQGIFGIGGETYGDLVMGVESAGETLDERNIKPEFQNKIVIGGSLFTASAFSECGGQGFLRGDESFVGRFVGGGRVVE